ncbi:MAG: PASTA domain-containing protein, partial [Microbacterium sp.]
STMSTMSGHVHGLRRRLAAVAAAAVPAIAAGGASDDLTQLLTGAGLPTQEATRILPSTGAATAAAAPADAPATAAKRRRSPWTWPLIVLIVLLLLVLGGSIWALVANQSSEASPTSTSRTPTPSQSQSSATPTPTATRANVAADDLIGLTCADASEILDELQLAASCVEGNSAPDSDSEGKVYDVNPTGNLDYGTIVTLTLYGGEVALDDPVAPTLSAATVEPNGELTVTWARYTCASGTGSVSSYNLTATNATFPNGESSSSFSSDERNTTLTATNSAGSTIIVSYTVSCSGGTSDEERTSAESPEATATIQAVEESDPSTDESEEG